MRGPKSSKFGVRPTVRAKIKSPTPKYSPDRTQLRIDITCSFPGIVIKCHQSRSLSENRKTARELLVAQWDVQINGEDSLNAQIRRIDEKRRATQEQKKRKLDALKKAWKEREGIE